MLCPTVEIKKSARWNSLQVDRNQYFEINNYEHKGICRRFSVWQMNIIMRKKLMQNAVLSAISWVHLTRWVEKARENRKTILERVLRDLKKKKNIPWTALFLRSQEAFCILNDSGHRRSFACWWTNSANINTNSFEIGDNVPLEKPAQFCFQCVLLICEINTE